MIWKQLSPAYRRLQRRGSEGDALVVSVDADRPKGRFSSIGEHAAGSSGSATGSGGQSAVVADDVEHEVGLER